MKQYKSLIAIGLAMAMTLTNAPMITMAEEIALDNVEPVVTEVSEPEVQATSYTVPKTRIGTGSPQRINDTEVFWFITSDGTLEITGSGDPGDFLAEYLVPWCYEDYYKVTIASTVKPKSMRYWFIASDIETPPVIPSSVTDCYRTFENCRELKTAPAIPSGVTNCSSMFDGCTSLTGSVLVQANPSYYGDMFKGVTNPITLIYGGDCTKTTADAMAATGTNVTVKSANSKNVVLSNTSAAIRVGSSTKLSYTYDGYETSKSWASSNTSVATVESNGTVKAVKPGTATITLTVKNYVGDTITKTCTVTVSDVAPAITSQPKPVMATLDEDVVFKVTANGTNNIYQWYMTDTIDTEEGILEGTAIKGAVSSTYTISAGSRLLDLNDKYFYCKISNEGNEPVFTTPAKLSVLSASGGKLIVTAEDYSGSYDGGKHTPQISCANAVIKYGMKEGIYDLDTAPEFIIAGKYVVYYEVSMEGYDTVTGSVAVEISHTGEEGSITIDDWMYGKEASEPVITSELYNVEDAIVTWSQRGMNDYSFEKPSVPGDYTVNVTFIDTESGLSVDLPYNFTIFKGQPTVSDEDYTKAYDGQESSAVLNCKENDVKITYGLSPDNMNLTEMPKFINVGEYMIYYEITGDYYEPVTGSLKIVITKADGTGKLEIADVLRGEIITPIVTSETNSISGTIYYKAENAEDDAYTTEIPTEPGTYTAKVILPENDNYKEAVVFDTFRIMEEAIPENTEIAPNAPEAVITVSYDKKSMKDVSLTEHPYWIWQDENGILEVNVPYKAVAIYTGMDAKYYKKSTVEVLITRLECSHPAEHIIPFGGMEASCTASGYTNYAICTDCNTQAVKKTIINATGHTWDAGKVTKEATASADGSKLFTCTVCGNTKTEPIKHASSQAPAQNQAPTQNVLRAGDAVTVGEATYKVAEDRTFIYTGFTQKSKTSVAVPASVTYKGTSYKVTAVADNAFKNSKKLKKVTVGKNITSIGKNAFSGCAKLTTVTMKSKVLTTIGDNAFSGCKKLKSFTIPMKVKKLGKKAFYNCKSLKTVTINSKNLTKKSIGKSAFKGIAKKAKIKVPSSKVKSYKSMLKANGVPGSAKIGK